MSPFLKKKVVKQKAEEFSNADQTQPAEPKECDCEHCVHFRQVLGNQQVLVQNQEVLLEQIQQTQKLMLQLSGAVVEEKKEPTQEELRAAWEEKQSYKRAA